MKLDEIIKNNKTAFIQSLDFELPDQIKQKVKSKKITIFYKRPNFSTYARFDKLQVLAKALNGEMQDLSLNVENFDEAEPYLIECFSNMLVLEDGTPYTIDQVKTVINLLGVQSYVLLLIMMFDPVKPNKKRGSNDQGKDKDDQD